MAWRMHRQVHGHARLHGALALDALDGESRLCRTARWMLECDQTVVFDRTGALHVQL